VLLDHLTTTAREAPSLVVRDTLAKNLGELIELSVLSFLRQNEILLTSPIMPNRNCSVNND